MEAGTGEGDLPVELARFDDVDLLHEYGLVILSQGDAYWIEEDSEGLYLLLVEPARAEHLARQIDLYEAESRNWPPVNPEIPEPHPGSYAAMTWAAVLVLAWLSQGRWPELLEWGRLDAEAVRNGETYRVFSALLLHSDIGHLAGNLLFGSVFLHLVARHTGTLLAWAGVIVAGGGGNLANALVHTGTTHYSIGASTAVFGAIGLLVALPVGFAVRRPRPALFRLWIAPVVAGLVFLAWFGTGGEQTDTSAHLFGFLSGLPVGLAYGLWIRLSGETEEVSG